MRLSEPNLPGAEASSLEFPPVEIPFAPSPIYASLVIIPYRVAGVVASTGQFATEFELGVIDNGKLLLITASRNELLLMAAMVRVASALLSPSLRMNSSSLSFHPLARGEFLYCSKGSCSFIAFLAVAISLYGRADYS